MSESSERQHGNTWVARLAPWLLVGGLVVFHAANNWAWLVENVTSTGWDKPRHLNHSLYYSDILNSITIKSLFGAMVFDPARPPLFPASAGIMYSLFGKSDDVAVMVNVIYMVILLGATYGIGRRWGGRRLGLVSVVLLSCFPMFYAMSRYFYLEFAQAAMVALAVYLLLATEGFQQRRTSLLLGLSLGLGLLIKKTFAVFALGPAVAVIITSGLIPMAWHRLKQRPHLHEGRALLALLGGLALAALWYLPNRETVHTLVLGGALFSIWWALAALTIYFAALPSNPMSNALSAFFLAASIASTWYLGRIEFLNWVTTYGYGLDHPEGRALRLDQLDTYFFYLRKLGNEHLSLVLFLVFSVVLVAAGVVYIRRQGTVRQALKGIRPEGWATLAWFVSAYALLTMSIYSQTRALTPVLPAVALIFGAALLQLPWRWIRWGVLALVLAFGLLQFFVVSYERVNRLLPPQWFTLPVWGQTSLIAQGVYIQLPDDGATDRGYWIEPDILERMEAERHLQNADSASLGLLVNTSQINAAPFKYLLLTEYPHLQVESLINLTDETTSISDLFAHDFVAIKRVNWGINPAQTEIISIILDGQPQLFNDAFELAKTYVLPDGEEVYLYQQRFQLPADYPVEYVTRWAESLSARTQSGDAILLTPPELVGPFVSSYAGPAEVFLVPAMKDAVADIAAGHRRVFLVLGDSKAGEMQGAAQEWFNKNGFRAAHEWADSLQTVIFGTVTGTPATSPTSAANASLGGQIKLVGYDLPTMLWRPGDIVPITLFWQGQTAVDENYSVFVHLIDGSGQPAAQTDSEPVGGSRPTSTWAEDEIIVDRHGLLLPDSVRAGEYELHVGMYLATTGERLPVLGSDSQETEDSILLEKIQVGAP